MKGELDCWLSMSEKQQRVLIRGCHVRMQPTLQVLSYRFKMRCALIALFILPTVITISEKITYTFPEFPYKETNKNEVMFHEVELACERGCLQRHSVSKLLCIRQCVSPSCYRDLYQQDLLEEGEVDVRLNSFKGCFIQRYNKSKP